MRRGDFIRNTRLGKFPRESSRRDSVELGEKALDARADAAGESGGGTNGFGFADNVGERELRCGVEKKRQGEETETLAPRVTNGGEFSFVFSGGAADSLEMLARSPHAALRRLFDDVGTVDAVGIEERVAKYGTRSIKKAAKLWGLKLAASMVDLTTLEGKDTPGKVASLCQKALCPHDPELGVPQVAAVCVYPAMVKHARKALGSDTAVRIASVATAFPSGQAPLKTRLAEVKAAVADGADEIDMVINRGAFLSGEFGLMQDEIRAVVEACGQATLKVILEVSELETYDNIRAASFLAMRVIREGDFIKTSTGKTSLNATLGNNQVMIEAIRDYYLDTGISIAMKPAGGIRTAKQALTFLIAIKETLGDAWLNHSRYRFGASALLNDLIRQIEKEKTGAYQAPYYFSEATESY